MIYDSLRSFAKRILPSAVYGIVGRVILAPRNFNERRHSRWFGMRAVKFIRNNADKKIILLAGVHDAGNIGDHAICIAERELLERFFPDWLIVELSTEEFCPVAARLKSVHCNHLVVAVHGGGFLGNLWISEERMFRKVLKTFSENKIVVFPQTIFFTHDKNGANERKISQKAYNLHPNLHFFIRDKSYEFMKDEMMDGNDGNVESVPDLVLSLDCSAPRFNREGILLVFRSDKEKCVDDDAVKDLLRDIEKYEIPFGFTDTCVPYKVPMEFRKFATDEKFCEFRKSRLVMTDRLHGMIFATITGTPCIAMNNVSKKVEGVYDLWLKGIPYVEFARDVDEAKKLVPKMLSLGGQRYDPAMFDGHWKKIMDCLGE